MKIAIFALLCLFVAYSVGQTVPAPRPDQWWLDRHASYRTNTANNPGIPIIFYGDSISEGWGGNGQNVFNFYYAPRGVVNYGIGGDQTQHVLWRILNGEIDGLNPRLIVLKIGTNNLGPHTDQGIADGVATIVSTLRQALPNTRILLLGILPRTGAANFDRITAINGIISALHDGQNVFFFNMFDDFRSDVWGVAPTELFFDGLHLTTLGYELWAHLMNPLFNQLLL